VNHLAASSLARLIAIAKINKTKKDRSRDLSFLYFIILTQDRNPPPNKHYIFKENVMLS